jgi:hypothetical protein
MKRLFFCTTIRHREQSPGCSVTTETFVRSDKALIDSSQLKKRIGRRAV